MNDFKPVYDTFFVLTPEKTIAEVRSIVQECWPDAPLDELAAIETDVLDLFTGKYPGYRQSTTHYHDLPHTMSVYLAVARLLHGMYKAGDGVSVDSAMNGLVGALLHDVGLIQTEEDTTGTGAKYTSGHEQRSMEFAQEYFARADRDYPFVNLKSINKTIACTILSVDPSTISFPNREIRLVSFAVGSADLYAQMADRSYLEKLLLLYDEFVEAHIPGYRSPLDLLRGTQGFWDYVVRARIQEKMDNIGDYFAYHFEDTIQRKENLYLVSIQRNLAYLSEVLEGHEASYREMLRRTSELILD